MKTWALSIAIILGVILVVFVAAFGLAFVAVCVDEWIVWLIVGITAFAVTALCIYKILQYLGHT